MSLDFVSAPSPHTMDDFDPVFEHGFMHAAPGWDLDYGQYHDDLYMAGQQEMEDYERAVSIREMMAKVDESINTSSQIKDSEVRLWLAQQYTGWRQEPAEVGDPIPEENRWTDDGIFEMDDHLRIVDHVLDPEIESTADVMRTRDLTRTISKAAHTIGPVTFSVVDDFSVEKPTQTISRTI